MVALSLVAVATLGGTATATSDGLELQQEEYTVQQGNTFEVSATVTNTGADDTKTLEYRIGDEVIDEQELALDSGESTTITFEGIESAELEPGEYTHGIYSPDDSATGTLTVEPPAEEDGETEDGGADDGDEAEEDDGDEGEAEDGGADEDGPGFGIGAALLAVLGAGLLARRRGR